MSVTMGEAAADAMSLCVHTGEIKFYSNGEQVYPENATSQISYKRTKNDKIINRVPSQVKRLVIQPDASLLNYNLVLAIDTNTVDVPDVGMKLSVTGVVVGYPYRHSLPNAVGLKYGKVHAIEIWGADRDFERIGWMETMQRVLGNDQIDLSSRVGVIVDSYLLELPDFNAGASPIIGDYFLPDEFELIYASSDKKNDSLLNKMLAMADEHARSKMQEILRTNPIGRMFESNSQYYRYYRDWNKGT